MLCGKRQKEHNVKPIIKQLVIGMFILALVITLSLGIQQVRFSIYRADIAESTPSTRPSDIEDQPQSEHHIDVKNELDYHPEDSYTVVNEPYPEYLDDSDRDEQSISDDYSQAYDNSDESGKVILKAGSLKNEYAQAKGLESFEKISLSDYEELYFSKEGESWYVSKERDGSTTKMQVQIDDDTGKFTVVDGGYYAKQEPYRIPMTDNEDIYLTEEGQTWYVSKQSDGSTSKIQLQPD
jgi:hypothetical protein